MSLYPTWCLSSYHHYFHLSMIQHDIFLPHTLACFLSLHATHNLFFKPGWLTELIMRLGAKKRQRKDSGRENIHCLCWTKLRRCLGPASEQREVLWNPAGPVSPSEDASESPAWLSRPETKQPAAGTPPMHVSCWTGRPWTKSGKVNYICVGPFQCEQHKW